MSNYRRLISYIYAYEGGIKGKNVGFAKLEVRNGQCKIQVNVRNVFIGSQDTGVFLLCKNQELLVGKIFIRNGAGEFRAIVPVNNIAGSGQTIDQCYGLTVHNLADSWQSYTTIWEDAVAHAAEVALEEATSEKINQKEPEPEFQRGSIADAVEAEIEAQSRLEELARRKQEESMPSSVVPPQEAENAEVGAMEIRPMEVLPIVGNHKADLEKETEGAVQDGEQEQNSGSIPNERPEQNHGLVPDMSPEQNQEPIPDEGSKQNHELVPDERPKQNQEPIPDEKSEQNQEPISDERPEQNQRPVLDDRLRQNSRSIWDEKTVQNGEPCQSENGPVPDPLMTFNVLKNEEENRTEAESGVAATVEESPELSLDTMIQGDPEPSELKVFTPRQAYPNSNIVEGHQEPQLQPQTQPPQNNRSDRMNVFGLPGWWGQQNRQSLWNLQNQFGQQGQSNQQSRLGQHPPFNQQTRTKSRGQSGNRDSQQQPEIRRPDSPTVQPEIQQPAGPTVQPEIQQPAGPAVQPRIQQPVSPTVQPEIQQPADQAVQRQQQQPRPQMEPMEEEPRIEAIWQEFYKRYPKIQAFDYNGGCDILTIKPQDIGLLPREIWAYGNNSFLLHGYYSHRYIIFARLGGQKGRSRYLLGVPGHYYSNEKYMASMFGFPNFVLSKIQPEGDGRFGYWYTDVRLGN